MNDHRHASAARAETRPRRAADSPTAHDIVVIGASAGAVPTLQTLVSALPPDFPGSVFIVVHMSPDATSELAKILGHAGPLHALSPEDGTAFQRGHVYVARPNCHMLLERDHIRIARGPKENRHRPAIDPLFRSAAWTYGPRVVGVVLTGFLDDGAAGLWAIRTCGGVTVVQEPAEAMHPEMPNSALALTQVDHVLPVAGIAELLVRLAREPVTATREHDPPASMKTELEFAAMDRDRDLRDMASIGKLSPFTCPACRGALWELKEDDLVRYRCHTGHAFSGDSLLAEQTGAIEEGLYSALRAVEEKATALRRLSVRWQDRYPHMQEEYLAKSDEMDASAKVLRRLLAEGPEM